MGSGGVFGGSWGVFGRSRGVFGGSGGVFGSWVRVFFIGVFGFSFVFDISDETVVVISGVGHNLDTTVGKVDSVRSLGVVSITRLFGGEVGVAVVVSDGISVLVLGRDIGVGGFVVCGGRGVRRGGGVSSDTGDEGKDGDL